MKRTFAFANATIASLVLLLVQCSGESSKNVDENEGGGAGESTSAGKGGSAGSGAGSAGKGGSAGSAGKGGSAGSSGSGAGTAGKGGTSAGSAGAGGTAGEAGSNGTSAGEGGAAGFDGTAGASGNGNGGASGDGGGGSSGDGSGGGSSGDGSGGTSGNGSGGASIDAGGSGGSDNADVAGSGGEGGSPRGVPPGDKCKTAVPAPVGSYHGESTAGGFHDDYTFAACVPYHTAGPDRVYQIRIPSGNRVNVDIDPTDNLDIALALVATPASNCVREPACLALSNMLGPGEAASLSFANDSTEDRDYFLLVDGFHAQPLGGSYDLDVAMAAVPVGDTCLNPLPLGEGTEIAGSLASEQVAHDYDAAACFEERSLTTGPDAAYKVDVPADSTLTVTINPNDDLDPVLFLLEAEGSTCNRHRCLGAVDDGYEGSSETVTYVNEGTTTQTVYLIVDSFASAFSTPSAFHLDVNLTP